MSKSSKLASATGIGKWWADAQYLTSETQERGECRVFDPTPSFVEMSESISKAATEVASDAKTVAPRRPRPR